MTSNEQRFWESAVAEAVHRRGPPDQTAEILARLAGGNRAAAPRRLRPWLRYPLELAVAATVVLAIGVSTGLLTWPSEPPADTPGKDVPYSSPAASVLRLDEQGLELVRGWALVRTGAPGLRCGASKLTDIQGVVLLRAGSAPRDEQWEEVRNWLNENQLETDMLKTKSWVYGLALAALVIQGSAVLDGQTIKAQDSPADVAVKWYPVETLREIDLLPPDATHVETHMKGDYLKALMEFERMEGLRVLGPQEVTPELLGIIGTAKGLKVLDLRGNNFGPTGVTFPQASLPYLKWLGVDLADHGFSIESLKQIADQGVKVEIGTVRCSAGLLAALKTAFPGTQVLSVTNAEDADLKELSTFQQLKRLELVNCKSGELGFVGLAKSGSLQEMALDTPVSLEAMHQIAKLKSLHTLHLLGGTDWSKELCSTLAGMKLSKLAVPGRNAREIVNLLNANQLGAWQAKTLVWTGTLGSADFVNACVVTVRVGATRVVMEKLEGRVLMADSFQNMAVWADENPAIEGALEEIEIFIATEFLIHQSPKPDTNLPAEQAGDFAKFLARCPKLKTITLHRHESLRGDGKWQPQAFVDALRKALPKVTIECDK
ncbi:MAG: hypothetical protein IT463_05270 [Planctomycetes bacterium]|nr:hypothetical protein [Planctomycetota bacterium]